MRKLGIIVLSLIRLVMAVGALWFILVDERLALAIFLLVGSTLLGVAHRKLFINNTKTEKA